MKPALQLSVAFACILVAPVAAAGYTWKLPKFSDQLQPGETIVAVDAVVHCMSVSDVRNIPDGWSVELRSEGETYRLRLERSASEAWLVELGTQERAASNATVQKFAFRTEIRGQWSDCGGVSLLAHTRSAGDGFVYSYRAGSKGWDSVGRKPE